MEHAIVGVRSRIESGCDIKVRPSASWTGRFGRHLGGGDSKGREPLHPTPGCLRWGDSKGSWKLLLAIVRATMSRSPHQEQHVLSSYHPLGPFLKHMRTQLLFAPSLLLTGHTNRSQLLKGSGPIKPLRCFGRKPWLWGLTRVGIYPFDIFPCTARHHEHGCSPLARI